MSLWGVHVGLAVIIASLIVGPLRFPRGQRWRIICISGIWATIPDWWWFFTDRFVPGLKIPWYAQLHKTMLHESMVANLFWFHGVIDAVGTDDERSSLLVAASSIVAFVTIELYLARGHTRSDSASS